MMLGINNVCLLGTVIDGPAFTKNAHGRDSATFRVKIVEGSGVKEYVNAFDVRVFGVAVNEIKEMRIGDICTVTGRLQNNTRVDSNNVVRKECVIVAFKVTWEPPVEEFISEGE